LKEQILSKATDTTVNDLTCSVSHAVTSTISLNYLIRTDVFNAAKDYVLFWIRALYSPQAAAPLRTVLPSFSGPGRDKVTRCWKKVHNEGLYTSNLYSSPNIITMMT
jgi:hypothetical protein